MLLAVFFSSKNQSSLKTILVALSCAHMRFCVQVGTPLTSFVDLFISFVFVFDILPCLCLVLQPCGHLLGKGWPLGASVCEVFMCFCHVPIRCPGSGVVLDCIDSWSSPSSLLFLLTRARNTVYCAILSEQRVVGCPLDVPISYYV